MSGRTAKRIAVLKGGPSSEREVSLVSGLMCGTALRDEGFEVVEVDVDLGLAEKLKEIQPDAVFNALHGRWGEDGCVQGILELLRIPYTHSGVASSAMAMDKQITKGLVYKTGGVPTPGYRILPIAECSGQHPMRPPYVLKPLNEGSSVGVVIVGEGDAVPAFADGDVGNRILVEEYVPGRELTVTVHLGRALTVTEIVTDNWYDYAAKYEPGGSRHLVPAEIPGPVSAACMVYAETAHRLLGCRGISRTDFRWDDRSGVDGLFALETNTQPGMTPTSLSPEQAGHCGISFAVLCRQLIEDASCRR